ncbi:MAG: hypothetical protein AAF423_07365 [Pseudomonadota bacterium]
MSIVSGFKNLLVLTTVGITVAGCAIRPSVSNLLGLKEEATIRIVQQIRCETRIGMENIMVYALFSELQKADKEANDDFDFGLNFGQYVRFLDQNRRLGERISGVRNPPRKLKLYNYLKSYGNGGNIAAFLTSKWDGKDVSEQNRHDIFRFLLASYRYDILKHFSPVMDEYFKKYATAVIGMEFILNTTEDNNANSGVAMFQFPSANNAQLSLNGKFERQRQSQRRFRNVESLDTLASADFGITLDKKQSCSDPSSKHETVKRTENYVYPITGSIGMEEILIAYSNLVEFAELQSEFSDELTFTTTVQGGADPSITLGGSNLREASVKLSNQRIDKHQLNIALLEPVETLKDSDIVPGENTKFKVNNTKTQINEFLELERLVNDPANSVLVVRDSQ